MVVASAQYNTDWIWSNSSNVHVANHRDWFTTFTPFTTHYTSHLSTFSTQVTGIGSVNLELQQHPDKPGCRQITLHNVFCAPDAKCNIFGITPDSEFSGTWGEIITIDDEEGRVGFADLIDATKLYRLRLRSMNATQTSLGSCGRISVGARWPEKERSRWEKYQEASVSQSTASYVGDAPYTVEEKAWLKKHYGGEYKFLVDYGLSIYKEEDRAEGRGIVRGFMSRNEEVTEAEENDCGVEKMSDEDRNRERFLEALGTRHLYALGVYRSAN